MSVNLIAPPPAYSFSADMFGIEFECSNFRAQDPVYSVNKVTVAGLAPGSFVSLSYNSLSVLLTAAAVPDDSGYQFPSNTTALNVLEYFESNYRLSEDFDLTAEGNQIVLTAKNASLDFDILTFNTVQGSKEVYRDNYSVLISIYCENSDHSDFEQIYNQRVPLLHSKNGKITLGINDKLHDYISNDLRHLNPDIPEATFMECKKSCRRYYIEYSEVYSNTVRKKQISPIFTVLHGGLSYRAQLTSSLDHILKPGIAAIDRFLKQGPRSVYTRTNQPQYLYFFNTRTSKLGSSLKVKYYFSDATNESVALKTFDLQELRKYAFNITFDSFYSTASYPGKTVIKYEVWLETSDAAAISETRTYFIDYKLKKQIRYFLNWSSFGSLDSRICYGEGSTEVQLFQSSTNVIVQKNQDIKRGSAYAYGISQQSKFTAATDFMSKNELVLWRDFYLSVFKYRFASGLMMPIILTTDSFKEIQDSNFLYAQQFEYRYLYDDQAYTEGDIEDSGIHYENDLFFSEKAPDNALTNEEGIPLITEQQYFITK